MVSQCQQGGLEVTTIFLSSEYNRGCAYEDQGNLGDALADFGKAIELDATYWQAFHRRGIVHHEQGNLRRACDDFSRALELKPKNSRALEDMKRRVELSCN